MGHYSTFVVRLWVDAGKIVGGTIQHVGASGKKLTFNTLEKMVDFITNNLTPSLEENVNSLNDVETPVAKENDNDIGLE